MSLRSHLIDFSCLGGIDKLIEHYDQSKDIEDKLGDLILWLIKLKDVVTTANANHSQEKKRSLEDIEGRSRALLGKGKAARIFDKTRDSGMVIKLAEDLWRAILIYQLLQQRPIDDQVAQLTASFLPLPLPPGLTGDGRIKASLDVLLKLREKVPGVQDKIDSALARLRVDPGNAVGDEGKSKRQSILFEALEGIKNDIRALCTPVQPVTRGTT